MVRRAVIGSLNFTLRSDYFSNSRKSNRSLLCFMRIIKRLCGAIQSDRTRMDLLQVAKLFSYTWTMGLFLCKSVHYMQSVSAICSVVTLTAMSIER